MIRFAAIAFAVAVSPVAAATPAAPAFDQLGVDGTAFDPRNINATVKSATLRSVQWNGMRNLPVCWENPEPRHEANRAKARQAVTATWEAAANVRFTGWGACQPGELAIRIAVGAREWPRAILGRWALRRETSMWLNFDMGGMAGFEGCANRQERCEQFTAVHEFGHTLGLIHEQDRPDTPSSCINALGAGGVTRRQADDLVTLSSYDPDSLMNYCNSRGWNPDLPLVLTDADRAGVIAMFGPRPAEPPPRPATRPRRPVFIPE